jgi:hypothetical protein
MYGKRAKCKMHGKRCELDLRQLILLQLLLLLLSDQRLRVHHPYYGPFKASPRRTLHASALQVVAQLRKEHGMNLTYIALDWHEMDKQLGHAGIVEAFWNTVRRFTPAKQVLALWTEGFPSCRPLDRDAQVKDILPAHGFALGTLEKVGRDHTEVPDKGRRLPRQPLLWTGMHLNGVRSCTDCTNTVYLIDGAVGTRRYQS